LRSISDLYLVAPAFFQARTQQFGKGAVWTRDEDTFLHFKSVSR
jgi:hypothetical protein